MAPAVILSMDVHCHKCAKKIRKAVMKKASGVESVTASVETGLVMIEGNGDAAALKALLEEKTNRAVNVVSVSDGAEDGDAASGGSGSGSASGIGSGGYASPPPAAPEPPPRGPIILETKLHCKSCAKKVIKRALKIPGVASVTTDVWANRVEVTGLADASAVATSLEVMLRTTVRVVSDPGRPDAPGYDHEQRKAAAAWAAAQQMREMYGEPQEAAADSSRASPVPPAAPRGWHRRRRACEPAPSPPGQPAAGSSPPPPPLQPYGAPLPQDGGGYYYYYPAPGAYWTAAPSQPPAGFYTDQWWSAYSAPEGYYPGQGGEVYGYGGQQMGAPSQPPAGFYTDQWPAYPPPESYYPGQGGEVYGGQHMRAPFQHDEEPNMCCVQ